MGLLFCGLLVPAHLRAVDASVLASASRRTPTLTAQGLSQIQARQLGTAQLFLLAAQAEHLPDQQNLAAAIANLAAQDPSVRILGAPDANLGTLLNRDDLVSRASLQPLTDFVVRQEHRVQILRRLQASSQPNVQALLRCRALTNTAIFPPSDSASGQAIDAAISITGLLLEGGHLNAALRDRLFALTTEANRGGNSEPMEQVLLDVMSLGQRLNWGQLVAFVGQIPDTETLRLLADRVRKVDAQLPVLFSAVALSGKPAAVAKYLMTYSQTGLNDLGTSLRFGAGGLNELLQRNQRLHVSSLAARTVGFAPAGMFINFTANLSRQMPEVALAFKWLLYLAGGFLLAAAAHFTWPAVSALEKPLQVRGFHIAREALFALGFLLVVVLLNEPFLAQESQKVELPFHFHLPMVGSVAAAGKAITHQSNMNTQNLLTLLLFFVLQGLIYTACLVKLAEIRRQQVPARIKLKLLENEDHLFDAGLYLGFVGTIVSFILVSMGIIQFSIMAAYSSMSFGIIFVSVFKIFHLRPTRRTLLMEAEVALKAAESAAPAHAPTFATTP
ncbi:MAG: hypothetical protein JWR69_2492 [Pedosphaera sp.]|nr:hypothetical protein [Pedosphaera sp.]